MPKTNAEYCRDYRKKRKEKKTKKIAKSATERVREFRARRKSLLDESKRGDASSSARSSAVRDDLYIKMDRPSSPGTGRLKKSNKIYTSKSFIRKANVEKLSISTNSGKIVIDPTSATGSLHIKVEPEEGGRESPAAAEGEAGPLRGAGDVDVKVELLEVEESGLTCDQREENDVISYNALRNEEDSNNNAFEPDAPHVLKPHTHQHYKCSACGGAIEGFRYACVQCADYDQCAECEASGAHAEHYVLRVPRLERAAELQTVLDRVRRDLAQVNIPVQIKLEKDDKEEEVGEEEILVLKSAPVELRGEVDPLQSAGAGSGVGGGAVKAEVIDTEDSDMTREAGGGADTTLTRICSSAPRSNKAPKTSTERSREFRARKAQLQQRKDNQVLGLSEIRTIEKRAESAEATRQWREREKGVSESSEKRAKTAAQRMREYRKRKKLAKKILLKQQSDQYLDAIVSRSSSQVNQRPGPSTMKSISAELKEGIYNHSIKLKHENVRYPRIS